MGNLEALKDLDLNLLRTSLDFLMTKINVNSVPFVNSMIVSNPMLFFFFFFFFFFFVFCFFFACFCFFTV